MRVRRSLRPETRITISRPDRPGVRGIALAIALALAAPAPSAGQGIWGQLSEQEQQAVLTRVRDELRTQLAADDSPVLPNLPDGGDDPRFKAVLQRIVAADTATIAAHAGELAAGEYEGAIRAGTDAAARQLAQYLLGQVTGRFAEDSATRVYLEWVAGKGDALTVIGQAFFDDGKSWTDFLEVTWTELNKAAYEDVQAAGEEAIKRTLNFALGEGSIPGMSPGEIYLEILKAEVVVVRQLEVASVRLAANNLYREYRVRRQGGAGPDVAWDEVYTLILGSSGMGEVARFLSGGSREDLRLGAYVLRHVDANTLRTRFEQCFQASEDPCTVRVETAAEQQQAEARRWVEAEVAELKQRIRGETALIGRDQMRSLYAHIGDSLRREIQAAYRATDGQQQAIREARYTAEARLARIRQLAVDVTARCGEFRSLEGQTRGVIDYFVSLDAGLGDVETLIRRAGRCEPAAPAAGGAALADLADLAARRRALVAAADRVSTEACSWADPATTDQARQVFRDATRAAARTAESAAQARVLADQLRREATAASGAAPAAAAEREAARSALRDRLATLDEAIRTADNVMSLRDSLRGLAARGDAQYTVGMQWLGELRAAIDPFSGLADLEQIRDEAQRLMGVGPYAEAEGTVLHCSASMQASLGALEQAARPGGASIDAHRSVLARWRAEADGALAACPGATTPAIDSQGAIAAANADLDRLESYESAAAICVGRAQQLMEQLEDAEADDTAAGGDDAAVGGGDADPDPAGDEGTEPGDEGTEPGDEGAIWVAGRVFMPADLPGMLAGLNAEGADPQQVLDQVGDRLRGIDPSAVTWTSDNTGEVVIRVPPEAAAAVREAMRGDGRFSVGVGMRTSAAGGLEIDGAILMEAAGAFATLDELRAAHPDADADSPLDLGAADPVRMGEGDGATEIRVDDLEGGWSTDRQQEAVGLIGDAMTTFVAAAMDPSSGVQMDECFVATAVYGDDNAPELAPLRRFRDRVLLTSLQGRRLVRFYYRYGPGWADWVRERPAVRAALRFALDRIGPWLGSLDADPAAMSWRDALLGIPGSGEPAGSRE